MSLVHLRVTRLAVVLSLVVTCFAPPVFAQKVTTFQKAFGGTGLDVGMDAAEMADGGFLTLSVTTNYGAGSQDLLVIRTDSLGRKKWSKTYGGSSNEGMMPFSGGVTMWADLLQTSDSNYIICSST